MSEFDPHELAERIASAGLESAELLSERSLDSVTWRDFSAYQLLVPPLEEVRVFSEPDATPGEAALLEALVSHGGSAPMFIRFQNGLRWAQLQGMLGALQVNWDHHGGVEYRADLGEAKPADGTNKEVDLSGAIATMTAVLTPELMARLVEMYFGVELGFSGAVLPPENHIFFRKIKKAFEFATWPESAHFFLDDAAKGNGSPIEQIEMWEGVASVVEAWYVEHFGPVGALSTAIEIDPIVPYPFAPYQAGSVNLGLRLTHRQEWRPLGNQAGEVVKTIPLGPRQVEKISTRLERRSKATRTDEQARSAERQTEDSGTTTDSSEITSETTRKMGWHVETEASVGIGEWLQLGLGGGASGEVAQSTGSLNSTLSEVMRRRTAASRSETRVTVSTETETSFEMSRASEIHNPNDEIAVTYVYRRLLRQYEILTSVVDAQPVLLVAERVPAPEEIGLAWIRRHDWVLRDVLLDASFESALTQIHLDVDISAGEAKVTEFRGLVDSTVGHLGSLAGSGGSVSLSNVDLVEESQRAYREVLETETRRARSVREIKRGRERLYAHIRGHILHYMRAIWETEDPQQRLQRYRAEGVTIPTEWQLVTASGSIDASAVTTGTPLDGFFEGISDEVPVSELVHATGPVGYLLNYSVHRVRGQVLSGDLGAIFDLAREPFVWPAREDEDPVLNPRRVVDPQLREQLLAYPPDSEFDHLLTEAIQKEMDHSMPDLILDQREGLAPYRERLAEFVFRRDAATYVLVDTNNLIVDVVPGTGSVLEEFKRAHRALDVLKASAEIQALELENERRRLRLDQGVLFDPDVDSITIEGPVPEAPA